MSALIWVVLTFLMIVSIIDWRIRKIPSIFLTGMLFVVAFISTLFNPLALSLGILGFIVAYLMYEGDFFGGVADIKVMTMISFMLLNYYYLLGYIVLIGIFGLTWKSMVKIRDRTQKQTAFIPVFFFVFGALILLGGLYGGF
jgi:hypothetical protein